MRRFLDRFVEDVCFFLVIVLTAVVFFQVFNRFILKAPLAWTEELAMLLFQWVVFLGAAVGVKRMSHFGIDLVVEKLPPKTRQRLELLVPLAIGAIAVTLIVEGFSLLKLTQFQLYSTMPMSHAWATVPMPISGVLMILYLVQQQIRARSKKEGGRP
jgi:TRAP-type C4-dicarboxylate transport system permease small subunit